MLADILAQLQKQASAGESGVAVAFELNWQSLELEAQKLACLVSLFALAPIPWPLVESAASSSYLEFDLKANCTVLVERYLLQELADDTYQVHELIQELLRQKLEELAEADELKRGFCQAMVAVAKDISQTPTLIEIAQVTLAIPHLAGTATVYQAWLSDDDLIWPFVGLSRFYQRQGAYEQALHWREQSLSAARKRFGDEYPSVATSLNNSAFLYESKGRYSDFDIPHNTQQSQARKFVGRDEQIKQLHQLLQANDVVAICDVTGQGGVGKMPICDVTGQGGVGKTELFIQDSWQYPELWYIEALSMTKRLLGDEHPSVATSLNNLALLYNSKRKYSEAEPLHVEALSMRKRLLGDEHPSVATSLNNLAVLYNSQGRYSDAEPLYIQALAIAEKQLGANHTNTIAFRKNLESLWRNRQP
ncbi:tetratricopeptide repeat protein [Nostoc sp. LEGE 12450]|uniref:tetratricopeptide repeat protein n=1 Tax=Nostoc sp. LEGE 12450 TaxID=1828643 RepID=UPI0018802499|nr:tetratricopeptide repeat protein [Nostoc sp. LEGE 12450]MBE8987910.1 tetratricopeptide repeat protein [Nostoc sp. LEGE 12450]